MSEQTGEMVKSELQKHGSLEDAVFLQRFFKTGEGQYGAGDVFIGIRVPAIRMVCKQFKDLSLSEIRKLLSSSVHEHRLAAPFYWLINMRKPTRWVGRRFMICIYRVCMMGV